MIFDSPCNVQTVVVASAAATLLSKKMEEEGKWRKERSQTTPLQAQWSERERDMSVGWGGDMRHEQIMRGVFVF